MCRLSMNQGRTPVVQILSFGRWFSRHAALPIRCGLAGAREKYSRRGSDRLDEPNQAIPWHGCIPAEPVAVLPGKIIVPRIVIEGVILCSCFKPDIRGVALFSMKFGTGFCLDPDCRFVGPNYHVAEVVGKYVCVK